MNYKNAISLFGKNIMDQKYQKRLSSGANNTVIALNEQEAAKLFGGDTRSDIGSEAEKMKFANSINELVVNFIRLDFDAETSSDMLVMERLYPIDFRCYETEKRELWFEVFEEELKKLHQNGFVHRDLKRPADLIGEIYDNVLLTNRGLRLIDVGISALKSQVGDNMFQKFVVEELKELAEFKEYFLNR
jgi:serine/threonine protein kinase